MDFSVKYRLMFYVSLSVTAASMITFFVVFPETILRMPLMSITENNTVTKEQLDGAKGILEQCVGSEQKINELEQTLFAAEKEYYLKNNSDNATKLFNSVVESLYRCSVKKDPEPNQFEMTIRYLTNASAIISAIFAALVWVGYRKKTGKDIID